MKRLLLAGLLSVGSANAQIPVTDVVSLAQDLTTHVETLLKWKAQYDQMTDQYEKLKNTHDAMTGVRNLGDIFDDPELRQYMPADWQDAYAALRATGYEGLLRTGIDVYNSNKVFDACAHYQLDAHRLNCEAQAAHGSQVQGDLLDTLDMIEERREQITSLQTQINTTTDPKAIGELTARIGIEQSAIANEASRLKVMADITNAQERSLNQREKEFQAQMFEKTKGIEMQPITFKVD